MPEKTKAKFPLYKSVIEKRWKKTGNKELTINYKPAKAKRWEKLKLL